ncbi:MAG: hypothetical protein ABIJ09_23630 [Pseudomonadota bacterium]
MSQSTVFWSRYHQWVASLAAVALLVSLGSDWLRGDGGAGFTAVQTAQLFMGPFSWLLLPLLVVGLLWLLLPLHAMRRLTSWSSICALPAWLGIAATMGVGVQHLTPAWGFALAGLAAGVLTAAAATELWAGGVIPNRPAEDAR